MAETSAPVPSFFRSAIVLPNLARATLVDALQARLMDGVDLYAAVKVAHWNVKGPAFGPIHALFDGLASLIAEVNDRIAERIAALGGLTQATVAAAAARSSLPAMPATVTKDLALVKLVADRLDVYLRGLVSANSVAVTVQEPGTVNLLGDVIESVGQKAWMVLSHLENGER